LSFRQEQLWILDKVARNTADYTLAFAVTMTGKLDSGALEAAVGDVLRRHTALRGVLPHEHPTGALVVREPTPVTLTPEPADSTGSAVSAGALQWVLREELERPLDLDVGPALRFRLLRFAADLHVLLWITHYAVFDQRSAGVALRDLATAYEARAAGRAPAWPEARAFGEYAIWQREWARGAHADAARKWWRAELAGWEPTEIPVDHHRAGVLTLAGSAVEHRLDPAVYAAAQLLAREAGVPSDSVFLAAFCAALRRTTSQDDLIIALPGDVPGPFDSGLLVGDCGNVRPLRLRLAGAPGLRELALAVQDRVDAGAEHAALPFKQVLEIADVEPDPRRLPLVQIAFEVTPPLRRSVTAGGLTFALQELPTGRGAFELALDVVPDDDTVLLRLRYAAALYDEATARRLLDRYVRLLAAGCGAPDRPYRTLPFASGDEEREILDVWNLPVSPGPAGTVPAAFARVSAAHPDRVALRWKSGTLTYAELDRRSNAVARRLADAVGPEDRVAILLTRGPDFVAAVLGALKAGAAYVPVDLSNPPARIETILEDCQPAAVVFDSRAGSAWAPGQPLPGQRLALDLANAGEEDAAEPPTVAVHSGPLGANLAYVIYTSGSTGRPKGVMVEHRNVLNFVRTVQAMFDLTPDDRFLQFASYGFDVSVFEIFGSLLSGASLYLVDDDERRNLEALDQILRGQEISVVDLPPTILELLDPDQYPRLRVAFVGGEAFSGELTTRWSRGRDFYNGYGPTEATVTVVAKRCTGTWAASPPIGRAMANHRAYVLDEDLGLVPSGAIGELAIAGQGLARGYLNAAAQTADRFRPDPYGAPGSRVYLSGDLALTSPDGDLVFRGRADRQAKVRGVRIELGEVEAALTADRSVARAVAEVVPDPRGGMAIVAYVVPAAAGELRLDAIRAGVRDRLPEVMVPSFLIPLQEIPLTPSGKVDRRALPPMELTALGDDQPVDEHRTQTEQRLIDEVFGPLLGTRRISAHDNFFALGGTSLQAIRIAPRVSAVFGVELPVAEFFQHPTVSGTARLIDKLLAASASPPALLAALDVVEGRSDEEIEALLAAMDGPDTASQDIH
jgi:amino acid adenylation domain-containing protein